MCFEMYEEILENYLEMLFGFLIRCGEYYSLLKDEYFFVWDKLLFDVILFFY